MTQPLSKQALTNHSPLMQQLDAQRRDFTGAGPVSAEQRIERLQRARRMIAENREAIVAASTTDFGCRSPMQATMSEVFAVMDGLQLAIKSTRRWMKPQKRKAPFPFGLIGAKARVEYQPKGVIGVLGTWNFPVYTALSPLAGIFAAGNRCMVKFSELTPATAELMCALIEQHFKPEELVGICGGPEVGAEFAALPLDHIIFTGGTHIGAHILKAAADNLTPCTLELGGKSPVILSRSYDRRKAVERIFTGKALNQGQACLAPDYVFVPAEAMDDFIDDAREFYSTLFPSIADNEDYTSIINRRHYDRVRGLIDDASEKGAAVIEINPEAEDLSAQADGLHKIPMTLVRNWTEDMQIASQEIFGPAIGLLPYQDISECIHYINARPRPLGLYYFGSDKREEAQVLQHTISGGVSINDVLAHTSCDDLPFGGIGHSGMGNYHGVDGFKTFSHARAVYRQSPLDMMKLAGMLPPYTDKAREQINKQCEL